MHQGTRDVALALHSVAHNDNLVEGLVVFLKRHPDVCLARCAHPLRDVTDVGHFDDGVLGHTRQGESAIEVGDRAVCRAHNLYRGAYHRLAGIVDHKTFHSPYLLRYCCGSANLTHPQGWES